MRTAEKKTFEEKFFILEREIENMCFYFMNDVNEVIDKNNNMEAFLKDDEKKEQVVKYFDKIYKRIKEQTHEGSGAVANLLSELNCTLNETFLESFKTQKTFKKCATAYYNCLEIAKIFYLYYYLCNYHVCLYEIYGNNLFKLIYKVLINFDQKETTNFLKEICTDGKMLNFYIELHNLILEDIDEKFMHELVLYENYENNK